eukprot:1337211-Pleurochrysis_carterae.AAC.1
MGKGERRYAGGLGGMRIGGLSGGAGGERTSKQQPSQLQLRTSRRRLQVNTPTTSLHVRSPHGEKQLVGGGGVGGGTAGLGDIGSGVVGGGRDGGLEGGRGEKGGKSGGGADGGGKNGGGADGARGTNGGRGKGEGG